MRGRHKPDIFCAPFLGPSRNSSHCNVTGVLTQRVPRLNQNWALGIGHPNLR